MEPYKHVLLAIDLHPDCDQTTAEQAVELAKMHKAKLTIVHAIEHINAYGVAQAYPTVLNLEQQLKQDANEELNRLKQKLDVPNADVLVEIGSPKLVVLDIAKRLKADVIVVGSHGRHGINMLLGSTANAILHNAICDVLAVRIQ